MRTLEIALKLFTAVTLILVQSACTASSSPKPDQVARAVEATVTALAAQATPTKLNPTATPTPTRIPLASRDVCRLVIQPSELPASFDAANLKRNDASGEYFSKSTEVRNGLSRICVVGYEASQYSARYLSLQTAVLVFESEGQAKQALQAIVAQRQGGTGTRRSVPGLGTEGYYYASSLGGQIELSSIQWRHGNVVAEVHLMDTLEKPSASQMEALARLVQVRLE